LGVNYNLNALAHLLLTIHGNLGDNFGPEKRMVWAAAVGLPQWCAILELSMVQNGSTGFSSIDLSTVLLADGSGLRKKDRVIKKVTFVTCGFLSRMAFFL
jgi:hypothetical protein